MAVKQTLTKQQLASLHKFVFSSFNSDECIALLNSLAYSPIALSQPGTDNDAVWHALYNIQSAITLLKEYCVFYDVEKLNSPLCNSSL